MAVNVVDRRRASLIAAPLLTLAAFGLRIYRLGDQSLWGDEIISYYRAAYLATPSAIYMWFISQPRHMVYGMLLKPWAILIPNEIGLRLPSVLAGTLAVAVMYQTGRRLVGQRAGLLAALFLALSPVNLRYAQEARQYALLLLLSLTSLWTLTLLEIEVGWARWAYPLSVALTTALHVVAALWLAVQSGILLARKLRTGQGPTWAVWLAAQAGLLTVPAVIYALESREWLGWIVTPTPGIFVALFRAAAGLHWRIAANVWMALVLTITLLGVSSVGLLRLVRQPSTRGRALGGRWGTLLLVLSAALPPLALYELSIWWRPIWDMRYLIPSMASILLLLALGTSVLRKRWLSGAVAAVILTGSLSGSVSYHFDPAYQRANWRGAATYVIEHMQPGDGLAVYRRFEKLTIDFFLDDTSLEAIPLSIERTEDVVAMRERMRSLLAEHDRVWVVWLKAHQQSNPGGWIEATIPDAVQLDYVDFVKLELYLYQGSEP